VKFWNLLSRLDRIQKSMLFKIIASVAATALVIAALVTYGIQNSKLREHLALVQPDAELNRALDEDIKKGEAAGKDASADPAVVSGDKQRAELAATLKEQSESMVRSLNEIKERRLDLTTVGIGAAVLWVVMLVIIWLGVALTYLAATLLATGLGVPLIGYGGPTARGIGVFLLASIVLAAAFFALIEGLRASLSASHPITSIARNVVSEAMRMRVSLIFIVMLVFGLAALPALMDSEKALRYQVQSFLTYGVGGTYWLIALLTVFLACATVAFEQRDKIIWQTMTKPVRAWEYVLGKWLGVVGVAAVLLLVSSAGCLMFTEYLRQQPAQGESRPFVSATEGQAITPDRLLLETQVLTAQSRVRPSLPAMDFEARRKAVDERIAKAKLDDTLFVASEEARRRIESDLDKDEITGYFAISPGQGRDYAFEGLSEAKRRGAPITLRYKIHAGSDAPTDTYRLTLQPQGAAEFVREVRLGQVLTEPLSAGAVQWFDDGRGGRDGKLILGVFNGDWPKQTMNKETISFGRTDFEIAFPVGTFTANFARVVFVMWLKLAFLAMVGIVAGTFLSFPVAALTSFGVFLCAEGAAFLAESLEYFELADETGTLWWRYPIMFIGQGVTGVFGAYSNLAPVENLVSGRTIEWGTLAFSSIVLTIATAALWAIGSAIFQRRELAIYSGQ